MVLLLASRRPSERTGFNDVVVFVCCVLLFIFSCRSGMCSACTLMSKGDLLSSSCMFRCYSICYTCRKHSGGCHPAQHFWWWEVVVPLAWLGSSHKLMGEVHCLTMLVFADKCGSMSFLSSKISLTSFQKEKK